MAETNEQKPTQLPPATSSIGFYDPVLSTGFTVISDGDGVTLAFRKIVYAPMSPETLTQVVTPAATVLMSMRNAKDLVRILGNVVAAYEAEHGEIALSASA